jgi:signal transduction histidine kinase
MLACVAAFGGGVITWAASEQTRERTLLWRLGGSWTPEDVQAATADLGISYAVLTAYFLLLDVVWMAAGISAAMLVLRGASSWFRIYLAVVLAVWSTTGGTLVAIYEAGVGGTIARVVTVLFGMGWWGAASLAYVFPDGRFVPAWTRWCAVGLAVYLPAVAVAEVLGIVSDPDSPAWVLPLLVLFATGAYAAVHRYRRSADAEQRRQVRGVAAALVLWVSVAMLALPLRAVLDSPSAASLATHVALQLLSYAAVVMLCLSVAVAVVRHRLYDVDIWVRRALAYGLLTSVVALLYAALAAVAALLWPVEGLAGPLAATVVVAVVLHPLRLRVQRWVDRVVYGHSLHPQELLADLRRSRERILRAREEERSRLQRDLHDGLGPTLASLDQRVDAARGLIHRDPAAAEHLLADVGEQTREVIGDIRALVQGLRPPELDQLGLRGSVECLAARLDPMAVEVTGSEVRGLPPAVEVAAYRIIAEALTNAARHAQASSARVDLDRVDDRLRIAVDDDGVGLDSLQEAGTGLRSMRERAEELGGTLTHRRGERGGTRVTAVLPCDGDRP